MILNSKSEVVTHLSETFVISFISVGLISDWDWRGDWVFGGVWPTFDIKVKCEHRLLSDITYIIHSTINIMDNNRLRVSLPLVIIMFCILNRYFSKGLSPFINCISILTFLDIISHSSFLTNFFMNVYCLWYALFGKGIYFLTVHILLRYFIYDDWG